MTTDTTQVEKKVLTILKVLSESSEPLGSNTIARELRRYGVFLTERAVRYHLKLTDERGYTVSLGRDGRMLTPRGVAELDLAMAPQQVGYILNKLELLAFYTTFDPTTRQGNLPINTSIIDRSLLPEVLAAMRDTISKGFCVSDLISIAEEGEKLGSVIIPEGKVGIATVCGVVINGVLLKAGVPVTSKFGGILEIVNNKPYRFTTIIRYDGTSVDPSEQYIRSGMTSIRKIVETGNGNLIANFREIVAPARSLVEEKLELLRQAGINGVCVLGNTSEAICQVPVDLNKVGMILLGGLNPIASAMEDGLPIENISESGTLEYSHLKSFWQIDSEASIKRSIHKVEKPSKTGSVPQRIFSSGNTKLDELLQGYQEGDNIVWQIDNLQDYIDFSRAFASQAAKEGRKCVYLRFASHQAILENAPNITRIEIDPEPGFNYFSEIIHRIIEEKGKDVYYIFDNLSALVGSWATDESLANFFQVTCPHILEIGGIAYFGLTRGKHHHSVVARIRETTQILIDIYHINNTAYIHPLKVFSRYSSLMFIPHRIMDEEWIPVFESGEAAAVSSSAHLQPLSSAVSSMAPWETVYRQLQEHYEADRNIDETSGELQSLKNELIRMIIGENKLFMQLAERFITVEDLINIRSRLIGSGHIGGKAAGMLLARRILLSNRDGLDFSSVLEPHDSFYIGSDVFFTFLVHNDLFQLKLQINKDPEGAARDFEKIEQLIVHGTFPREIVEQFRDMLGYFGQAPVIARSSSLMEDNQGNTFANKYLSIVCPNQGDPEERLEQFMMAIKQIYASTLHPDAIAYRQQQGLSENDEQMAVLVQRISGIPYRNYFFPPLSGVALSRNPYHWNSPVDSKQGVIKLVFGLGTRAVQNAGDDISRIIAISNPSANPVYGGKSTVNAQRTIDLIDMETNSVSTLDVNEVLKDNYYPNLYLYASQITAQRVQNIDPLHMPEKHSNLLLTFNTLIEKTQLVPMLGQMVTVLEKECGHPVDTEFTARIDNDHIKINLLQCRTLQIQE